MILLFFFFYIKAKIIFFGARISMSFTILPGLCGHFRVRFLYIFFCRMYIFVLFQQHFLPVHPSDKPAGQGGVRLPGTVYRHSF